MAKSKLNSLLLGGLLSTVTALTANAADAGDFYTKLELGYQFGTTRLSSVDGAKDDKVTDKDIHYKFRNAGGINGAIGVGYNFSEEARGDVTLFYKQQNKTISKNDDVSKFEFKDASHKLNTFGVLANVYYDFNNDSSFIPFVGVGAGVQATQATFKTASTGVRTKDGTVLSNKGKSTPFANEIKSKRKYNLALRAIAGFDVKVADNLYAGLSYNLSNGTKAEHEALKDVTLASKDFTQTLKSKSSLNHAVMAQLRVYFN